MFLYSVCLLFNMDITLKACQFCPFFSSEGHDTMILQYFFIIPVELPIRILSLSDGLRRQFNMLIWPKSWQQGPTSQRFGTLHKPGLQTLTDGPTLVDRWPGVSQALYSLVWYSLNIVVIVYSQQMYNCYKAAKNPINTIISLMYRNFRTINRYFFPTL